MKSASSAVFALVTIACQLHASTIVDTTPGNNTIGPFTDIDWATWGQTFEPPVGENDLASFSVTLNVQQAGEFAFFVMAWTGTRAIGPVLFQSDPVLVQPGNGQTFTFQPGITLTPGQHYVAFVNNSFFQTTGDFLEANMVTRTDNPYPNGQIVGHANRSNFFLLTESDWPIPTFDGAEDEAGIDLAFRAEFAPTPIPVEMDIRPGSEGNPVNVRSQGVLRAVLLASSSLDIEAIDIGSLRLGPGAAAPLLTPRANRKDVNGDGRLDLVVFFRTDDLALTPEITHVAITGSTTSGNPMTGICLVSVRP